MNENVKAELNEKDLLVINEPEKKVKAKATDDQENCLGITSLVFGILAIASQFISVFPLSAYFPFVGLFLALGDKLKNKKMTTNAKIGLILSIVSYAASVLSTIIAMLLVIFYCIIYCLIFFSALFAETAQF